MWTEADLNKEIKRISHLVQNKDRSEEDLFPLAKINMMVRDFKSNSLFTDASEQDLAIEKFRSYLTNNEIESNSDLDTLRSLIFNEVLESRIQKQFNKLAEEKKYPTDKLIKSLVDIQDQKSALKIKLGIDKKADEVDDLSAYQLLHKRVDKYVNDHKDEFTIGLGFECEKCSHQNWETFLLYKRVKDFKMIKHGWFAGRFLFNYELMLDVKNKKISKEQATRYLMCSGQGKFYRPQAEDKKWCNDYVDYLLENWLEITELLPK
jgi:hypothetical protein